MRRDKKRNAMLPCIGIQSSKLLAHVAFAEGVYPTASQPLKVDQVDTSKRPLSITPYHKTARASTGGKPERNMMTSLYLDAADETERQAVDAAYRQGQSGAQLRMKEQMQNILQAAWEEGREKGVNDHERSKGADDGGKRNAGMDSEKQSGELESGAEAATGKSAGERAKAQGTGAEARGGNAGEGVKSAKNSIKKTTDNRAFVEVEGDILAGVSKKDWVKTVKKTLKKKFPNGIAVGNNQIKIDGKSRKELSFSKLSLRRVISKN